MYVKPGLGAEVCGGGGNKHRVAGGWSGVSQAVLRELVLSRLFSKAALLAAHVGLHVPLARQEMGVVYVQLKNYFWACTRLYKPLCRSICRSIGWSLFARRTQLMAIGLV